MSLLEKNGPNGDYIYNHCDIRGLYSTPSDNDPFHVASVTNPEQWTWKDYDMDECSCNQFYHLTKCGRCQKRAVGQIIFQDDAWNEEWEYYNVESYIGIMALLAMNCFVLEQHNMYECDYEYCCFDY